MQTKYIGAALAVLFVAYLFYLSMGLDQVTVEVCMEFRGGTACRTAAGTSEEEARKTAIDVACAMLASGRDDSIACSETPPASVRRVE